MDNDHVFVSVVSVDKSRIQYLLKNALPQGFISTSEKSEDLHLQEKALSTTKEVTTSKGRIHRGFTTSTGESATTRFVTTYESKICRGFTTSTGEDSVTKLVTTSEDKTHREFTTSTRESTGGCII